MRWISVFVLILWSMQLRAEIPTVVVGSKNFPESYILAEILSQTLEETGKVKVVRKFGMAGTGIVYQALSSRNIDIYPEYTGTLSIDILKRPTELSLKQLRRELAQKGLFLSEPLGFNNSYGLAMKREKARQLGIEKISDLKRFPELRMTFSYEFMERDDGYPGLMRTYNLQPRTITRMDHSLVYAAIEEDKTDIIEVYTTDSKVMKLDLVFLKDDLEYFPKYEGLYLYTDELKKKLPEIESLLQFLEGDIDQDRMIELNGLVEIEGQSFRQAASSYRGDEGQVGMSNWRLMWRLTKAHTLLVLIPVLVAFLLGVPLGILATRSPFLGRMILVGTGLFQTIPSLALLCFLIPLLGIGLLPSITALILYALLPIVRSTYSGIVSIENKYLEMAEILGLGTWQKLFRIELPLASIHILSGIQTAAVISVGLATLAAFIGAGGYGSMIVTGLALNDNSIILQGALPAALMAIVVHFLFELIERSVIPKGLLT
jgi:osmoprotectant transport system permease protein